MKNRKFVIPLFTVYDCERFENYLEKQAENGWMLEKANTVGIFFKKTEPKAVHFSVKYLPQGSIFESEKSEKYEDYKELTQHSGWKLIAVSSPHMFFCSEEENPTPIETDPVLAVETVHNVTKKSQLPLMILWTCVGFINCLLWLGLIPLGVATGDGLLATLSRTFAVVTSAIAVGLIITEVVNYKRWHKAAVKLAEEENTFLSPKSKQGYIPWAALLSIAGMCFSILSLNINAFIHVFIAVVAIFVLVAIILGANSIMRKLNVPTKTNRIITVIIGVIILAVAFCLGVFVGMTA